MPDHANPPPPAGSPEPALRVRPFPLGPHQTNCYVLLADGHAWIIDAGYTPGPMIQWLRAEGIVPEALVLTHAHCDHMAGLDAVRAAFPGLPVWMHAAEADWLGDPALNLSAALGMPATAEPADRFLAEGDALPLGGTTWRVLHTPGHSPGSISIVCEQAPLAFVGDALFAGSIGRTDFPTSVHEDLVRSIRTKLYTLDDATTVLSGHGPTTTIGREKGSNPFVRP